MFNSYAVVAASLDATLSLTQPGLDAALGELLLQLAELAGPLVPLLVTVTGDRLLRTPLQALPHLIPLGEQLQLAACRVRQRDAVWVLSAHGHPSTSAKATYEER